MGRVKHLVWRELDDYPPTEPCSIMIVCANRCSYVSALFADDRYFQSYSGKPLEFDLLEGALWIEMPEDYEPMFTFTPYTGKGEW